MIPEKYLLLITDLYWLRYEKEGQAWYELTDYLRDKLVEDGYSISYDDKEKTVYFGIDGGKPVLNIKRWINEAIKKLD